MGTEYPSNIHLLETKSKVLKLLKLHKYILINSVCLLHKWSSFAMGRTFSYHDPGHRLFNIFVEHSTENKFVREGLFLVQELKQERTNKWEKVK